MDYHEIHFTPPPLEPSSLLHVLLRHLWDGDTSGDSHGNRAESLLVHWRIDHDSVKAVRALSGLVVELERELDSGSLEDGWGTVS